MGEFEGSAREEIVEEDKKPAIKIFESFKLMEKDTKRDERVTKFREEEEVFKEINQKG
jgi:hypothetical protein